MTIKHFTFDIEQKDGWIVASTPGVDRDKDRVFPLGLDIANYQRNPVLMFGHRYDEPWSLVGKAAEIVIDETGMRIRPELREPATPDDPMHIIKALWDQGMLRAASIGFRPTQAIDNQFGGSVGGPIRRNSRSMLDFVIETHPAVGEKLGRARCRNTALPRPATLGPAL
jgi:hypothetical protein